MSTLTRQLGLPDPDYSDKAPEVKSSFVLQQEAIAKKAQEKKTESTKES
jgi:hypothetical protein